MGKARYPCIKAQPPIKTQFENWLPAEIIDHLFCNKRFPAPITNWSNSMKKP